MDNKYNKSSIVLVIILFIVTISGYFILDDKPRIEKNLYSPVPSEKNDFQYEPAPCLNEEGVLTECKG